jgi:predicted Zn-dependent protease
MRTDNMKKFSMYVFFCCCTLLLSCSVREITDAQLEQYGRGKEAYLRGDLVKAEQTFRGLTKDAPRFYQAGLMLGKTLFFSEKPEEAGGVLAQVVRDHPCYSEAHIWLIRALLDRGETGETEKAEERLDTLLSFNPHDPRLLHLKAAILEERGDIPGALTYLKQTVPAREEYARISLDLARLYYRLGLDGPALEELRVTAALLPEDHALSRPVMTLREKMEDDDEN